VFERFTEAARRVVALAQDEAVETLKQSHIGTEHILLGLLREGEGLAARVLESSGITLERVRGQLARTVPAGENVTSGRIPLTPRAEKVLEHAQSEAHSLGHNYIGTEHLLLGLTRESEAAATRILLDLGADPQKIRSEVIRMLSGPGRQPINTGPEDPPTVISHGRPTARMVSIGRVQPLIALAVHNAAGNELELIDLVAALTQDKEAAALLAELGIDVIALRESIERRRPRNDPPQAPPEG